MRARHLLQYLLLLICLAAVCASAADIQLENFEDATWQAERWRIQGSNLQISRSSEKTHEGEKSLCVVAEIDPAKPQWNYVELLCPQVTVTEGDQLVFWFYPQASMTLYIQVTDAKGFTTDGNISVTADIWNQVVYSLTDAHIPNTNEKGTVSDLSKVRIYFYDGNYPQQETYISYLDYFMFWDRQPPAPDANAVANGGFEDGFNRWSYGANGGALTSAAVDESQFYTGSHALKITNRSPLTSNVYGRLSQGVMVEPNTIYRFSCWLKGTGVGSGNHWTDWNMYTFNLPSGTFDWTYQEGFITTKPGQKSLTLGLNIVNTTGALWIDDINLRRLIPNAKLEVGDTVSATVRIKGDANCTQVGDYGFSSYKVEYGVGAEPEHWVRIGKDYTSPVAGGTLAIWDTTKVANGIYTIRLSVTDSAGFSAVISKQIEVRNTQAKVLEYEIFPTAISPNGDGIQDQVFVRFVLSADSQVALQVKDSAGSVCKTVTDALALTSGEHTLTWDGTDANSQLVAEGVYKLCLWLEAEPDLGQTAEVMVKLTAPAAPSGLAPSGIIANGNPHFQWEGKAEAQYYVLELASDSEFQRPFKYVRSLTNEYAYRGTLWDAARNLVVNYSFENGFAGWWYEARGGAKTTAQISHGVSSDGMGSVCLINNSGFASGTYGRLQAAQAISVQPNTTYVMRAYVKGVNVGAGSHFTDWNSYQFGIPAGTYDWQAVEATFKTKVAQTTLTIGLNLIREAERLWIDQIELFQADDQSLPQKSYWWRVKVVDLAGLASAWSAPLAFELAPFVAVESKGVISPGQSGENGKLVVNFIALDSGEVVYQIADKSQSVLVTLGSEIVAPGFHVSMPWNGYLTGQVASEGSYFYKVTNLDFGYSALVPIIVDMTPPAETPALLTPQNESLVAENPTLAWSIVTDELTPVRYLVERSEDPKFAQGVRTELVDINHFKFPEELVAGQKWYWRITAQDQAGNRGKTSSVFSFQAANLQEEQYNVKLGLFNYYFGPLPLLPGQNGFLQFTLVGQAKVAAKVYNLRGRLVKTLLPEAFLPAGDHSLPWGGDDQAGRLLREGPYVIILTARTELEKTKKVIPIIIIR